MWYFYELIYNNMKTFKEFINESLRDKIIPISEEKIK